MEISGLHLIGVRDLLPHNFQADPMVINAHLFDFRLNRRSPCIDAGSDIGRPFQGKTPDVGLYEFGR